MTNAADHARPLTAALLGTLLLAGGWASIHFSGPPAPAGVEAPPTTFSAGRAMAHVQALAASPHPMGSGSHAQVRGYLQAQVERLGLRAEVQEATAVRSGRGSVAGRVTNVLVRLPGQASTGAVLLASHYDASPVSLGAADAGSGVAAILETLRALRAGPPLRNDVLALFTDGEEDGLLGAEAFVDLHPWAREVRSMVNLEARGTSGASQMFETTTGNNWVVGEWASATPHPTGSSLSYEVYKRLPNDTDLTEFKQLDAVGLNFAFVEGWDRYHTPLDAVGNLDAGTLQQHGESALAMAQRFGMDDLTLPTRGEDAVYFSLPGFWRVVHYPARWATPAAVGALLLWLLVAATAVRRRQASLGGACGALVIWVAFGAAAVFGGAKLPTAIAWLQRRGFPEGNVLMTGAPYAWAMAALILAAWLAIYVTVRRRISAQSLAVATTLVPLVGALAAAHWLPGGSYVLLWPVLGAVLGLATLPVPEADAGRGSRLLVGAVAAVPVLAILPPLFQALVGTLGMVSLGTGGAALVSLVAIAVLTPQMEEVTNGRSYWPALAACALVAAGLHTARTHVRYSPDHPRANAVIYVLDADAGQARWAITDDRPDAWQQQFVTPSSTSLDRAALLSRRWSGKALAHDAPVSSLEPPKVTVERDITADTGERTLTLRVVSARQARAIELTFGDAEVASFGVDDRDAAASPAAGRTPRSAGRPFVDYVNPAPGTGFTVTIRVTSPGPLTVTAIDRSHALPADLAQAATSRPGAMMTAYWGDMTLVKKRYTF